ncbi:NAD(P)-binding protein [Calocera viscosa TUFC12733]|uniref:NAD(P)-binding protein n=1 Tax=Calocera viscosa (strain TUFC12733) TaxID=1330018 RepID=A0A167QBU1_CALVF|nr:NAD(P)-binding protein [Calocera viscosa TUFC12733]
MASSRLQQVQGHLSASAGKGLLAGEVAIITGAFTGIGRSAALLFAAEGAKVVVSDLDEKKAQLVVDEIHRSGGTALAVGGDVGADDFPEKVISATIAAYGQINHIVNNAGFTYDKMLHTMADESWDIIQRIHVRAPFRLVRAAAPYLRLKGEQAQQVQNRSIVNVSSVAGLHGNTGQANYAAAKAAVIGLTKTIAKEWGPFGVRANTVAYGYIQTRLTADKGSGATMEIGGQKISLGIPNADKAAQAKVNPMVQGIPLLRAGTADEAANAMLFLCSPLASYVSGHTLEVTGGSMI